MTEGLVIFDPNGHFLKMNLAALTLHVLQRHLHELTELFEFFDLDGNPIPVEIWPIGRVLNGETFRSYEVRFRRRDRGKTWIGSYSGSPIRDRQGRVPMNIITIRDITDPKPDRAQEQCSAESHLP
jgi:PAS domain S-box-containing protein